jgi:hypothetical protein
MKNRRIIKNIFERYNNIPVKNTRSQFNIVSYAVKPANRIPSVAGLCAAVSVLLVVSIIGLSGINSMPGNNSIISPQESPSIVQGVIIPDWYAPQKLEITTVTFDIRNITRTAWSGHPGAIRTDFPEKSHTASSGAAMTAKTTDSSNITISSPQLDVTYYVSPKTKEVVEPYSLIRETMQLSGAMDIHVMEYGPTFMFGPKNWEYIYYYTYPKRDRTDVSAYCMEVATGAYKQLPSEINWRHSRINVTSDGKYMSVYEYDHSVPFQGKVSVIDTETMSVKVLADELADAATMISPTSQYLFYSTAEGDTGYYGRHKMGYFYNFKTGAIVQSPVDFDIRNFLPVNETAFRTRQFVENDRYFIGMSAEDHITPIIVETSTGQKADNAVIENSAGRYAAIVGPYVVADHTISGDYTLYRSDFLTEDLVLLTDEPVYETMDYTYTVSGDGKYVYIYYFGDTAVKCVDIVTLQSFTINISGEFADQIALLNSQSIYTADYSIQVSNDNTQVVLSFRLWRTDKPYRP